MGYPSCLQFFVSRLAGISTNTSRIYPMALTQVGPSQVASFLIPVQTLVDYKTFQLKFTGATSATIGAANGSATPPLTAGVCSFPRHIETLVDSYRIMVNGAQLADTPPQSNQVMKALLDMSIGGDRAATRQIMQGQIMQNFVESTNSPATGATTPAYANGGLATGQFTIANWLGFLGTCSPNIIPSQILGDVRIDITFAPSTVLYAYNCTNPTYTLSNLYATVQTYSIDDGMFYELLQKRLQSGPLQIPYQSIVYNQGTATGLTQQLRLQTNMPSVDMALGFWVASDYTSGAQSVNARTSHYFDRISQAPGQPGMRDAQWSVNGTQLGFPATPSEVWSQCLDAFSLNDTLGGTDPWLNSLAAFQQGFFLHPLRLDLKGSSDDSRTLSGLNSREGGGSVIVWQTNAAVGDTTTAFPVIAVIGKRVWHVGAGRDVVLE